MSGAPKRSHEEGSNSTSSKRLVEETPIFPNLPGKLVQSINDEHQPPYELGNEIRLAKGLRIESCDGSKGKTLIPIYQMPSSTSDSNLVHPIGCENRSESRDCRESMGAGVDNREMKAEPRPETRMDSKDNRNEKDLRSESRGDNRKLKSDREFCMGFKRDSKTDWEAFYTLGNSHQNWNEPREHHRGHKRSDSLNDGMNSLRAVRSPLHGLAENAKETSLVEGQEKLVAHDAVGENRVDMRGEDKVKEKERRRRDDKLKETGELDKDRNDRRNNLQMDSSKRIEFTKEERERWEREKKDVSKDKERTKDRDGDHMKKEILNVNEKESFYNEKEHMDRSIRMAEMESSSLEPQRRKEIDSSKSVEKDAKDRKREKDLDGEACYHVKRSRCSDKESNDGYIEGDRLVERDRETFGHGVQQRRRMLRPRGTIQACNREPRFPSRTGDMDGSQVKLKAPAVVYKAGECMQELIKLWKEFEASEDYKNGAFSGPNLEIRIPAEFVTATNRQVRGGQLWGTDIYTNDSDLVAVLMHTGYCSPTVSPPPPAIQELHATIRMLPPQDCYTSSLRNNVRSRAWGAAIGCSYCVERCCIVKKGGGSIDLEPCLMQTSALEPTLAPVTVERTMTTRSAASNALRQQRFMREVTVQYNLCNEPWIKYSLNIVADKGLKKQLYTSLRLKKGEVLYLESHLDRYELCFNAKKVVSNGPTAGLHAQEPDLKQQNHNSNAAQCNDKKPMDCNNIADLFRWSRCKRPLPQKVMRSIGVPLPLEHIEVLEENLDWEDVQWSQTGVWIAGKEYQLARVHFLSPAPYWSPLT